MKYPLPLIKGSKIAVTAFSSGVPASLHKRLCIVIENLKEYGFKVVEGECLYENNCHVSASAEQRAAEFMTFLCDDTFDAVVPPWGGEFAMDILPLLDYEKLRTVKPKWVFGYSDVSTISTALTTKLDWVTVHSSNLMDLHPSESEILTASTIKWLMLPVGAHFEQCSSTYYQIDGSSFSKDPNFTFNRTELTEWKLSGNKKNSFSGRLIGGCFDTMMHLVGTEYFDIDKLHRKFAPEGLILYLENVEMSPTVFKRALQSLKYKGVFQLCNGLLIGRSSVLDRCGKDITVQDALLEVTEDLNIPVIYDADIGHLPPNMTLFNGSYAEVDYNKGKLYQSLK
ncbi:S66 peptidase family protein [Aliivibrio sp. SR45-2]|uniref:S66 family peptidase n=1 Tax=Aliivibrio sp. SR45-2 TaxID=2760931 RepID=UPI0015FA80DA|nr:S66 peptidase family protein [Aliivibrio sp. SR45-2]MBB1315902.1 LD-carboxypeptidase [Aliivibrio sp. SR45-2]